LNFELYISKKINKGNKKNFSRPIVKIAIIGIALSVAVMLLSVSITLGFKKSITEKVIGFGGHIQIGNYNLNNSFESKPIEKNKELEKSISEITGVKHIQVFAYKAGMIKTDNQIQGVVLKGVDRDFNWDFIEKNLVNGRIINFNDSSKSNEVLVSNYLADKLQLGLNQKIKTYFIIDEQLRGRTFNIVGIYETGLDEFDKKFVFADIAHIQKLNNWDSTFVDGYEVLINNIEDIDKIGNIIYQSIGYQLNSKTIKELHPEIFDWLSLTDMNVVVILVIISLISSITIISTLLITILERINTIGILRALGTSISEIRKIFIYNALFIVSKGIIAGNLIAIIISIIQIKTGILKLDQASYYIDRVPININIFDYITVNIGIIILSTMVLLIPSYVVSKISPAKVIRYE
jgi:lipoprotein-releasing system permease protein